MAALKLITLGNRPLLCISLRNGATRCHCPPFSQAEMAALKLNTFGRQQAPAEHLIENLRHMLPLSTLLTA
eukprot:6630575-Karenia_brevis.AAC.1